MVMVYRWFSAKDFENKMAAYFKAEMDYHEKRLFGNGE